MNWPVQLTWSIPFFCISPAGYRISGSDGCFIAYKQFYSLMLYYLTEDLVFDDSVVLKAPAELLPCKDVDYLSWKYFLKPKQTSKTQTTNWTIFKTQTNKQNYQTFSYDANVGLAWNYGRCGHPRAHVEALKLKSPSTAGR